MDEWMTEICHLRPSSPGYFLPRLPSSPLAPNCSPPKKHLVTPAVDVCTGLEQHAHSVCAAIRRRGNERRGRLRAGIDEQLEVGPARTVGRRRRQPHLPACSSRTMHPCDGCASGPWQCDVGTHRSRPRGMSRDSRLVLRETWEGGKARTSPRSFFSSTCTPTSPFSRHRSSAACRRAVPSAGIVRRRNASRPRCASRSGFSLYLCMYARARACVHVLCSWKRLFWSNFWKPRALVQQQISVCMLKLLF